MAGITQESSVALFPLWSLKKFFCFRFFFFWEGERQSRCESTETHKKIQSLNLIRSHVIITTIVTVIIISLITNMKIAIIIIVITKNDYHNNNNSNNNNNNNNDKNKSTNNSNNI